MQPILAIDTSGGVCGIALYSQTHAVEQMTVRELAGVGGHSRNILPMIDEVLSEAQCSPEQLGAIAFNQGPGAFTGVRLGCSVAQGVGLALDLPVVPVGALPSVARALPRQPKSTVTLIALDARMSEVYFAGYGPREHSGDKQLVLQWPMLIHAQDCLLYVVQHLAYWLRATGASDVTLAGDGWGLLERDQIRTTLLNVNPNLTLNDLSQTADTVNVRDIARLGWSLWHRGHHVLPEHALPLYLRDKVAFTISERAQGLGGNPRALSPQDVLCLPMCLEDLPEVMLLEQQSQEFAWREGYFRDALAAGYPSWVLRLNDALLGFCVSMVTPDEVHVLTIAVSPESRRRGLGGLLLKQVFEVARQSNTQRVLLEVRPSNDSALAFYKCHGFSRIGMRRDYYEAAHGARENALVMARALDGGTDGQGS